MGRYLLPEDERSGASPAVVIGYSVWQSTFAADPGIVGQQVQLGGVSHTVVGVMPRGFGFPRNHQYWTPLKAAPLDRVTVFARLAPGATLESAQAQLASVGFGASPPLTESGRPLRPFVRPYVIGLTGDPGGGIMAFLPLVLPLLLLPPCANIGVLMYARIVARQGEFAVRTSLGASRGRIVVQVFVEMLVLAGTAAAVAIALAPTVAETLSYMVSADQPFWMHFGFSYTTILFAGALALVAALIAGGIPALRATQGWQLSGLNTLNRASAPQLGRTWTLIVVAQIALSVAVVPIAAELAWNILRPAILGPGFPVQEFLTARLDLDTASDPAAATARFNALRAEVVRQLQAEPGITAVTASESKPFEERGLYLETDQSRSSQGPQSVAFNQVDSAFLDAFGLHILAGRGFEPRDNDPQGTTVLVNRSFVNHVFPGETPLGRTVRVVGRNASASRYEIVGLVDNQFAYSDQPTMYRPLTQGTTLKELQESAGFVANPEAGAILSVNLAIHMSPTAPPNFAGRLREVTAAVAPGLRVDDVQPLSDSYFFLSLPTYLLGSLPVLVALGVLLFATAGIYTRMSFAVVHRRREIGIRSALGASPRRLIAGIFRSVLIPVAAGVATGALVALLLDFYLSPMLPFGADGGPRLPWILPAAEAFVLLMGVFALFGPVRRTLQVDAVEALREG
jgi:predicted permease